ncbi:hypothetical protein LEP1GSC035_2440 [Leptospira noguchii str. 2007001578]|uniref:Uncharacterized protein n=1 Tax=Leptospira noguchii str. 2007001578 TaxID=1049974 RepID=A0ABP2TEB0_9LEPT|nr:hypothetical protein LEP1GSC035_2440 [Leptospira noguchii str. 2007001578]
MKNPNAKINIKTETNLCKKSFFHVFRNETFISNLYLQEDDFIPNSFFKDFPLIRVSI